MDHLDMLIRALTDANREIRRGDDLANHGDHERACMAYSKAYALLEAAVEDVLPELDRGRAA